MFSRFNCIYVENPKESMEELLGLISRCKMVFGYRVSKQNQLYFYISTTNTYKVNLRKLLLFAIASKTIEYLIINPTKVVQKFYTKKYKILL